MRLTRLALAALAATLALLAGAGDALAYPQFQLSTGNARCQMCHLAPAGGGLVNSYGRSEAGDTISQFGGDGSFLYGVYEEPAWLKLGVDLRGMALIKDYPEGEHETAIFPMQGDTYAFASLGDFALSATIGPRAQVRRADSVLERFGAREYYLMWRPATTGWYARAGRFHAPAGLRGQDHTVYVRRYQGSNIWEEPFAVSGGKVEDAWEAHVTAFAPVPTVAQGAGPRDLGVVGYYERRLGDDETTIIGGQARIAHGPDSGRYGLGGVGKRWWEGGKLLFSGQLDLTLQDFAAGDSPSRAQLAGYLGATWFPKTGFMVTASAERFDPDLAVKNLWRDAYGLALQYFPLAHWEIMVQGKVELPGNYGRAQTLGFLQLHYYL